jgi:agmatine/peptidylarginine deiminase
VIGFSLSDADMRQLVVPVYISAVTLEMLVKTGDVVLQGSPLYSNGDGTVTITNPGTGVLLGFAVNPNLGQNTVEMAPLPSGQWNIT